MTATNQRLRLACADLDARPLFWTELDGRRFGYEPAVAEAVADTLELELEWTFLRWSDFAPALFEERVDAIWCGSAITPEREQQFLYSRPYAVFHESVLIRNGEPIHAPEDLAGRKVGAIAGSTNMALAEQWPGCERIGFDGTSDDVFRDMIDALRQGEIDAVVDDEPAFGGLLDNTDFELAFTVPTANRWGAAMRPDSQALKQEIDRALISLIESGQLRRIWQSQLKTIEYPEI